MAAEEFKSHIIGEQANVLMFVYTVATIFSGDGLAKSLIPITSWDDSGRRLCTWRNKMVVSVINISPHIILYLILKFINVILIAIIV
ncbi:hypothetical protein Hanom_Chr01g00013901 [Helianthus anomalus]